MTGRRDRTRLSLVVSIIVGALLLGAGWFAQPRAWATSSLPECAAGTVPGPEEGACLYIPVLQKNPLTH